MSYRRENGRLGKRCPDHSMGEDRAASSTYSIDDPNYSSTRSIVHNTNMGVVNQTISSYTSLSKIFTKWYNAFY